MLLSRCCVFRPTKEDSKKMRTQNFGALNFACDCDRISHDQYVHITTKNVCDMMRKCYGQFDDVVGVWSMERL